jgi:hypothetical protein
MTDAQFWAMAYLSVLSIRLHPRGANSPGSSIPDAIFWAREAADASLLVYQSKRKLICQDSGLQESVQSPA